ncbi:hypothetical protein [Streptomyces sp. NBC_00503]|uniref:hypothetical protein n=1 Tax=Streptomyces sp. NBC_00503 TaxID=2903659 RepID=UPI002E7FEAC4|nr:hypothetical protein [Streptomyces sp. NBC_00503]WUD83292.1 hypothetical protein OG490_23575 [Streptomyces sp. NBC_00503]
MGWSFKLHGALAGSLSAIAVLLGALTFLPGRPVAPGWWRLAVVAAIPLLAAALVRIMLTRTDRGTRWLAFRCLPGTVQMGLAALLLGGAVLVGLGSSNPLQDPRIVDSRYYAWESHSRITREVSRSTYEAVAADQTRLFSLGMPAVMLAAAAGLVLVAGELRRDEALTRQQA